MLIDVRIILFISISFKIFANAVISAQNHLL